MRRGLWKLVGAGVRLPASKELWARVRLRVHSSGSFHSALSSATRPFLLTAEFGEFHQGS